MSAEEIARRVAAVRERIASAARRSGRDPAEVTLVAASKTVPAERLLLAREAGIEVFGENRVQEAEAKIPQVDGVRWHLIGHLQRNKARRAVSVFELIHSLESRKLGEALDRLGCETGRPVHALIEVNVAGEASKAGVSAEGAASLAADLSGRDGLLIRGLMTIPPPAAEPAQARPWFRALRELAGSIGGRRLPGVTMDELSMGMTDDFETAVEEGATLVRVGRAIFGER